jgi:hypothetical protein
MNVWIPWELILARDVTVLPRGFWPPTAKSPSVTSARCYPLGANSRPGRDGVTERILATYRKSPSVASVTSVRCFPRGANSRPGRGDVTERILATYRKSPSVASVTSVRCYPLGANSRSGRDGVAERILATYRKIPSVTSVTSVRCYPWELILARDAPVLPRGFWPPTANPPLWPR